MFISEFWVLPKPSPAPSGAGDCFGITHYYSKKPIIIKKSIVKKYTIILKTN